MDDYFSAPLIGGMEGWSVGRSVGRTDGWTDGRMDGRTDGWTEENEFHDPPRKKWGDS